MGRPIQAKWFTVRVGDEEGDLQVTTTAGAQPIIKQTGTGVYQVDPALNVKLIDGAPVVAAAPGVTGDAQLQYDNGVDGPQNVRKLNQFRVYYFDTAIAGGSDEWNDGSGNVLGTFTPPITGGVVPVTATGTVVMNTEGGDANTVASVTITAGGAGYTVAPTVTFSAGDGAVPVTATGTAVLTGDAVTGVTITDPGSYADGTTPTVTFSAP